MYMPFEQIDEHRGKLLASLSKEEAQQLLKYEQQEVGRILLSPFKFLIWVAKSTYKFFFK